MSQVKASAQVGDPFDALGDGNRRAIVELLGSGERGGRTVREIADVLPISRPAVSRHLRLLKEAGLVIDEARGTRRLYRLHDEGVSAVQAYLQGVWGAAAARFRLVAENTGPTALRATEKTKQRSQQARDTRAQSA
jgi:DNA-binding transcriptional ArsR family regulator